MACKIVRTAKALTRQELIGKGVIDKYNKILDLSEYRRLNSVYSDYAQITYNIGGRLLLEDGGRAIFNAEAFYRIDAAKNIYYKENEYLKPGPVITDPILNQVGQKDITPEVKERLIEFLKGVNPDFNIEVVDDLSVNGLTNLNKFLFNQSINDCGDTLLASVYNSFRFPVLLKSKSRIFSSDINPI